MQNLSNLQTNTLTLRLPSHFQNETVALVSERNQTRAIKVVRRKLIQKEVRNELQKMKSKTLE